MAQSQLPKIPKQTLSYLLICVGGIVVFFILGVYPTQRSLTNLDIEIAGIKVNIEEQKVLHPLYETLEAKTRESGREAALLPPKTGLSLDQIDKIAIILGDVAKKNNLETVLVTPDVKSLSNDSNLLLVQATFSGALFDFRNFLMDLLKLPYVEHLEELRIHETKTGKELGLKLSLLIHAS